MLMLISTLNAFGAAAPAFFELGEVQGGAHDDEDQDEGGEGNEVSFKHVYLIPSTVNREPGALNHLSSISCNAIRRSI